MKSFKFLAFSLLVSFALSSSLFASPYILKNEKEAKIMDGDVVVYVSPRIKKNPRLQSESSDLQDFTGGRFIRA